MSSEGSRQIPPIGEDEEKLTDFSRRKARRWLRWAKTLKRVSYAAALAGAIVNPVVLWIFKQGILLLSLFTGWFDKPIPERPLVLAVPGFVQSVLDWEFGWGVGTYLFAAAIVGGGIMPLVDHFKEGEKRREPIRDAGLVPRYEPFTDGRPTDKELLIMYLSRMKDNGEKNQEKENLEVAGFGVPGVPVYFVIPPHEGFNVLLESVPDPSNGDAFDDTGLSLEAAKLGLDWLGFSEWWSHTIGAQWFDRVNELCVRCTERPELKNNICRVHVTDCSYEKYLVTERAVNLSADTRLPDMRRLFEGKRWDCNEVDLLDFAEARERFSMLISVAALVTTKDNFLVLQRRSNRVAQGLGVITTTCNGFANWEKDHARNSRPEYRRATSNLREAALRELYEETAIPKCKLKTTDNAFIGAAFNLLHGRDLNFYVHFETSLCHSGVAERRKHATSRWEVASLIFVPLSKIAEDGLSLLEPFDRLLPECARHLRGAIYALANSGRLKRIQENSV
ncbi:MAG: hypothetical protein WCD04_05135 [Terriglobia bacterium]|jgi:hypothetical protein